MKGHAGLPFVFPVSKGGASHRVGAQPYRFSVLGRTFALAPTSEDYCRVYYDGSEQFAEELFSAKTAFEVTCLHRDGFYRVGNYGVEFPLGAHPPRRLLLRRRPDRHGPHRHAPGPGRRFRRRVPAASLSTLTRNRRRRLSSGFRKQRRPIVLP